MISEARSWLIRYRVWLALAGAVSVMLVWLSVWYRSDADLRAASAYLDQLGIDRQLVEDDGLDRDRQLLLRQLSTVMSTMPVYSVAGQPWTYRGKDGIPQGLRDHWGAVPSATLQEFSRIIDEIGQGSIGGDTSVGDLEDHFTQILEICEPDQWRLWVDRFHIVCSWYPEAGWPWRETRLPALQYRWPELKGRADVQGLLQRQIQQLPGIYVAKTTRLLAETENAVWRGYSVDHMTGIRLPAITEFGLAFRNRMARASVLIQSGDLVKAASAASDAREIYRLSRQHLGPVAYSQPIVSLRGIVLACFHEESLQAVHQETLWRVLLADARGAPWPPDPWTGQPMRRTTFRGWVAAEGAGPLESHSGVRRIRLYPVAADQSAP
ncbi:MAG: hypothetical protein PF961_13885 [Planctomycetota bacterium]|jgi:hypothetical protein|nr:hypothetical protein [Planctomycetota bacterium]